MTARSLATRLSRLPLIPSAIVLSTLILAALVQLPPFSAARPVVLLLLVGGVSLVILVREPAIGLPMLASLSMIAPFEVGTGTAVALTPPVFIIVAWAGAWLLSGLLGHSIRLPRSRPVAPLLLFLSSTVVSLVAGRSYWDPLVPQPANLLLVQLGQLGIFFLSAAAFLLTGALGDRGRWLERGVWVFLAVATVVLVEFYVPPLRRILGWSSGTMANRSLFWVWLGALLTAQLLFNQRLKTPTRVWLVVLLAMTTHVTWFRMNDWISGWAPFTAACIVVVSLWALRRGRLFGLVTVGLILVLAIIVVPYAYTHAGGEQELDASWGGRQMLYSATIDLVKGHSLLGLGPAAYRQYGFTRWLSMGVGRALWLRPNISSHNNYIDIYAQAGLVGLGFFLWFLAEITLLSIRLIPGFHGGFERAYVIAAVGGIVGTIVAMMLADWFLPFVYNIGFPGFRTSALAWMFLGGLVALERSAGESSGLCGQDGLRQSGAITDQSAAAAKDGHLPDS